MQEAIDRAKAEFLMAKGGLRNALASTPDDRLLWSPSDTARSPLHVAAHAAMGGLAMVGNLRGDTFAIPTTEKAEQYFRNAEKSFSTREQVENELDKLEQTYFAWLDALTPERLELPMNLPFGMGEMPTSMGIAVMPLHMNWHTAQLNYIQTIYGDLDWHV